MQLRLSQHVFLMIPGNRFGPVHFLEDAARRFATVLSVSDARAVGEGLADLISDGTARARPRRDVGTCEPAAASLRRDVTG